MERFKIVISHKTGPIAWRAGSFLFFHHEGHNDERLLSLNASVIMTVSKS